MDTKLSVPKKIKLIVTIVNRGKGEQVTTFLKNHSVSFHLICLGLGTAPSEVLDYFGLGQTEKDVVLSVCPQEIVPQTMQLLGDYLHLHRPGYGIAFSVDIKSVGGPVTLSLLSGLLEK